MTGKSLRRPARLGWQLGIIMADQETKTADAPIDYLEEDFITVPGQTYALVSFVSPTSTQKCTQHAMKIRGVFNTREEAATHVRRLQKTDGAFDIFVCEMYKWTAVPPDLTKIDDVEYQESFLNDMIKGYHENQLLAKQHFNERKQLVMQQGLDAALSADEKIVLPDTDPHPSTSGSSSSA